MKSALPVLLLPLTAVLLVSCATSSGSLLQKVRETEAKEAPQEKKAEPIVETPGAPRKGLKIASTPSDAEVYLNGVYKGRTPLAIEDLDKGTYRLRLQKSGYYAYDGWLEYVGDPMVFATALREITGFLVVHASPPSADIQAADIRIGQGITELRVGVYEVTVRRFGFEEFRTRVTVREGARTELSVDLAPSRFVVKDLSVKRSRVNPESPGLLGAAEVHFRVTAPGSGEITVRDASETTVARIPLAPFADWDQNALWNLQDGSGRPVADGVYVLFLAAGGAGGQTSEASTKVTVDRSLVIAPRSLWSGSPGLLFAPTAESLPAGLFQGAILLSANIDPLLGSVRAPAHLCFRLGLGEDWEIDAGAGIILNAAASPPMIGSLAVRRTLVFPDARFGFGAALEGRVSWQAYSTTDPFSNFTGAAIGVPVQFTFGPLSLLAGAQLVLSPWRIRYDPYAATPTAGLHSWMYLRGGLLLDTGGVSAGVSAAVRSTDFFTEGFAPALPFQAGAELHWVIPGTHLFLSGALLAEIESPASWYGLGGGGLGILY